MCANCLALSRRGLLAGGGALAATLATGTASARIPPAAMTPLIGPGYKPTDRDEIGIWKLMDRVEEEISGSNLLIQDKPTTDYVRNLIGRVGGPAARDLRIYVARSPEFNAVMFPTGFAIVFSGLLLRMRSEAQLAGVIAHESGHFLRKHQIRQWRDMRMKTDILSILAMGAGVAGGAAGIYTGNITQLAQLGTILSLLKYSRTLEAEADAMGLKLIAEQGLRPMAMSETWDQLIAELDASARYRRRRHRERRISLL
jgi:predicted Zn-dependent protease